MSLMMVEKVPDSTYDMIGGLDKQIKEIKEVGRCGVSVRGCGLSCYWCVGGCGFAGDRAAGEASGVV